MNPLFTIETRMKKENYKSFLYIATFFSDMIKIPTILVMSAIGTYIIGNRLGKNVFLWAFLYIILFSLMILAICYDVERKNKNIHSVDDLRKLESLNSMRFYEDYVEVHNRIYKSKFSLEYKKINKILESRDFFILFISKDQAMMIRKEDVRSLYEFTIFLKEKFQKRYKKIIFNI